jgi:alkylhydroperoxidase family enzyme
MILLRWFRRAWKALAQAPAARLPGPSVLPAYARMGRYGAAGSVSLEPRLRLLVQQLAAELAECGWCVEHGRHLWRRAFLSLEELQALRRFRESRLFSDKDRAALAFTEAVSRYADRMGGMPDTVLTELRRHFSEAEVAALTLAVTSEHFFNPATGALGADTQSTPAGARRAVGSGMRNLW